MKRQLVEFASIRFGVNAKGLDLGPMALVQAAALGEHGELAYDHIRRIAPAVVSHKPDDLLRAGDVLLVGKGNVNHAVLWPGSAEGTLASSTLYVIRPDPKQVLPAYLVSYLNSTPAKAYFAFHQKAGTVKVLGRAALNELMVPVPPMNQQLRMVHLAEATYRTHRLLNELSQAHAQLLNTAWATLDQP